MAIAMMTRLAAAAALALVMAAPAAGGLQAQQPPGAVRRQAPPRGEREQQLMQRIEEMFATQVQRELVLTDDQMTQVREILRGSAARLRELEREDRGIQQALRAQLRPGVAAQTDSVSRLLERVAAVRVQVARAAGEELAELARVLTPVQQAQYFLLRDRLRARAYELRMQRGQGVPPGPMS